MHNFMPELRSFSVNQHTVRSIVIVMTHQRTVWADRSMFLNSQYYQNFRKNDEWRKAVGYWRVSLRHCQL